MSIAIAAPNAASADTAATVVENGGNAVDAALAAAMAAMVSEPGVVAPGAGAFVTIASRTASGTVHDGYMAVPGLGGRNSAPVDSTVSMPYGGGVTTVVGPASIAVPGAWAAFGTAHEDYGRLPWAEMMGPVIALADAGAPLGATSLTYLRDAFTPVFSVDPASRNALAPEGHLLPPGALVRVEGLATTLEQIAARGAGEMYAGELSHRIAEDLWQRGSHVSPEDLSAFGSVVRQPLSVQVGEWKLSTNPIPAVGGAALVAMLRHARNGGVAELMDAQRAVYSWRRKGGDIGEDRESRIGMLVGDGFDPMRSASTAHVSTAGEGVACAVTLSAGYGSGVIPTGTGMWMNNGLGEVELVGDRDRLRAGERLNSNMAPTVGTRPDGALLAIGSPGADRITSALAQTLLHLARGASADEAISAPRVHVDVGATTRIAFEPGIEVPDTGEEQLPYPTLHMYFGGVGLAMERSDGTVEATTDPRRNGVAVVVG